MKNTNEKINAKEYEAAELTDEELAKVVGGVGAGSCPNDYTLCNSACLNANCIHLVQNGDFCSCGNGVFGKFKAPSGDDIGKLAKQ